MLSFPHRKGVRFPARREYENAPDPVVRGQGEQNDAHVKPETKAEAKNNLDKAEQAKNEAKEQVKNDSAAVDSQSTIYQKASNKNHKACL